MFPSRLSISLALAGAALVASPAANASGGGHAEAGAGPAIVTLRPMEVPIVDGARADGRLRFTIGMVAADAASAAHLTAETATLREAVLLAAGEFARLRASPQMPVDAERLSAELNAALHTRDQAVTRVLLLEVRADRA